jgi:hypothetical protein
MDILLIALTSAAFILVDIAVVERTLISSGLDSSSVFLKEVLSSSIAHLCRRNGVH